MVSRTDSQGREPRHAGWGSVDKPKILPVTIDKWQRVVDILARVCEVPTALIMKVDPPEIEAFLVSNTDGNPYDAGERANLDTGLYCEHVMTERSQLLVHDASEDPVWDHNPDIPLGMTFYLGHPLLWPDGFVFGTICVLDHKDNPNAVSYESLLVEFKHVIEADLESLTNVEELRTATDALQQLNEQLEKQVEKRTEQLAQSNRELEQMLRSKNEWIASISHELRTPLTSVLGFARVLQDPSSDLSAGDRAELRQSIVNEGTDLANIVDDLLVAARAETETLSVAQVTVNLQAQIAQVLEGERPETAGRIRVTGDAAQALGDPARVRQIIRNLISNVVRYGGCTVRIELGGDDTTVWLAVIDDGPGVPAQEQHRIFEPYWQAHQVRGQPSSLGLGLSVSRDLARLMGGDLVYRHEDAETSFELSLPRTD